MDINWNCAEALPAVINRKKRIDCRITRRYCTPVTSIHVYLFCWEIASQCVNKWHACEDKSVLLSYRGVTPMPLKTALQNNSRATAADIETDAEIDIELRTYSPVPARE